MNEDETILPLTLSHREAYGCHCHSLELSIKAALNDPRNDKLSRVMQALKMWSKATRNNSQVEEFTKLGY